MPEWNKNNVIAFGLKKITTTTTTAPMAAAAPTVSNLNSNSKCWMDTKSQATPQKLKVIRVLNFVPHWDREHLVGCARMCVCVYVMVVMWFLFVVQYALFDLFAYVCRTHSKVDSLCKMHVIILCLRANNVID